MLEWCRKKMGSTGERLSCMYPKSDGCTWFTPPMSLWTLLWGWPSSTLKIVEAVGGDVCEAVF